MPKVKILSFAGLVFSLALLSCSEKNSKTQVSSQDTRSNPINSNERQAVLYNWNPEECGKTAIVKLLERDLVKLTETEFNQISSQAINCATTNFSSKEYYEISTIIHTALLERGQKRAAIGIATDLYCGSEIPGRNKDRIEAVRKMESFVIAFPNDEHAKRLLEKMRKDLIRQKDKRNCIKNDCSQFPEDRICFK